MLFIIVLAVYLVIMAGIGVISQKKIDNSEDYFLAGRGLPWPVLMLTMSATFIGANATLAKVGLGYTQGMSAAIMSTAMGMVGMVVFGFLSPRVNSIGREYNISSVSQLIRYRFGPFAGIVAAVIVIWAQVGTLAGQVTGAGSLLPTVFKSAGVDVSYEIITLALVLIMILYTLMSGMFGVAYTDVIQVLILLICLACFLPFIMISHAGGWEHIAASLPPDHLTIRPNIFTIGLMMNYLFYFMSGPPYWQRAFAAKTPKSGRTAIIAASALILIYTVLVTTVGIAALVLYPTLPDGVTADSIAVIAVLDMYHPIFAAVVVVAIMAAIMSTMDSYLLTAAQAMIADIVMVVKPGITLKQELKYSKIAVALIAMMSYLLALYVRNIIAVLQLGYGFYSATMAAPIICATFWRKSTREGCLASMFCGCTVYLTWRFALGQPFGLDPSVPGGWTGILVMIIVSLLTYKKKEYPYFELKGEA